MGGTPPINAGVLGEHISMLALARDWSENALSGLEEFVLGADDFDLFRVNPIQYGSEHGLSEAEAIDLFVHSAKIGLFEMDWLLLCSYCPQVAGSFRELDQVHPRFSCSFCNANNDASLDDYIQVAFTVSEKVRPILFHRPEDLPVEDYYLRYNFAKGFIPPPGMTPEDVVAMLSRAFADIESGDREVFNIEVTPGRFEVLDLSHKLLLVFFTGGDECESSKIRVDLDDGRFVVPEYETGPRDMALGDGQFSFRQTADLNPGKHSLEIENRMGERGRFWIIQYPPGFEPHLIKYEPFLSGKRLLLTPSFAELFKTQLVDEGEGINVSDLTFLFTDLKDSTPLYDSVGDVNAYFMVRQHFEILNVVIRKWNGIIVKTIGDAVMAAFEQPADAVSAGIEMIEDLKRFNQSISRPLGLKVGIHKGQSIAVTLNERIDYFGQDVNIAARVQGLADINEVCVSDAVMEQPGVSKLTEQHRITKDYVQLKGVRQKLDVHRILVS